MFSELDSSRQKSLYKKFEDIQVLMTGTLFKFKPDKDYLSIIVNNGKIKAKLKQKMN